MVPDVEGGSGGEIQKSGVGVAGKPRKGRNLADREYRRLKRISYKENERKDMLKLNMISSSLAC
ncbi:hypothetical protein QJS04_geneDACA015771 [Acorus gramineus]|uniref:Uncharacterized protein n=1 Tax=Acorus gramineus TaxID=55184 RepID=A0AAV9BMU6_ACOGR|nr:hypothetical protein QJS04_geneDACA015771 [Acorus gramineus]